MSAFASPKGLCALIFETEARCPIDIQASPYFNTQPPSQACAQILAETKAWLSAYFLRNSQNQPFPRIDLQGSEFSRLAWSALLNVPFGTTRSYGALAKDVGRPNAYRAIGKAMGKNPVAILIPCHRIMGANGALTGYSSGLKRKEWLLKHEGLL